MDALAGYGSDDSSSSSSSPVDKMHDVPEEPAIAQGPPTIASSSEARDKYEEGPEDHPSMSGLPPPFLRASVDKHNTTRNETTGRKRNPSMIEWEVDYVSNYTYNDRANDQQSAPSASSDTGTDLPRLPLQVRADWWQRTKLKLGAATNSGGTPASTHSVQQLLEQQHDFHNPRHLDHAARQSGIRPGMYYREKPSTTTASTTTSTRMGREDSDKNRRVAEEFEDYEFHLVRLEEQHRIQAFRDQQ